MAVAVTVKSAALQRSLERLYGQLKNPTQANRAASVQLYGWVIRNYDSEGQSVGGWVPVAESTRRRKEAAGKERILVMTGTLRSSILPFYDSQDAGVGTEVEYSAAHQYGDPSHNLPARPFIPDRDTALEIGINVYGHYVRRAIEREALA